MNSLWKVLAALGLLLMSIHIAVRSARDMAPQRDKAEQREYLASQVRLMEMQLQEAVARRDLVERYGRAKDAKYLESLQRLRELPTRLDVFRRRLADLEASP